MEAEADFGEDHLGCEVSMRRRSQSFNDDYSVQRTNDDATQCKYAAVQLKYWEDKYLPRFIFGTSEAGLHRDPEISIGYWARVGAIRLFIDQFLKEHKNGQIVSLGCGFDTLFWRLKENGQSVGRYVEVDFSSVTARKMRQIRKPGAPNLVEMFSEAPKETQHTDMHCGDYHLVGADMRQWNELKTKLESADLDTTAPTLILAECVLVYIGEESSSELIKNLGEMFTDMVFVNYEQLNVEDQFGKVMQNNLLQRGLQLPGLGPCASVETQRKRFVEAGYKSVEVYDMNQMYTQYLDQGERKRIESIEHLDEMELLTQLLHHYCIVYAGTKPSHLHK